jgi:predicted tellurium resistance membrane protein TerC
MGVDNVLGVAGAAQGSFLLVVLGLVISVPIMVWGSTLVLKLVDKHPWIITAGAGVLIWTALQMILDEKLLAPYLPVHNWFDEVIGAALTFLIIGFLANRKRKLANNTTAKDA